jgi:TolB protein
MSQDGTGLEQVTEIAAGACQPSWAPDGLRFAFTSPCAKRQAAYPGSGIFIADADGGNITPLASAPGGDYDPDWSPDGNTIAFTSVRDNIPHIYTYDLSTNQATLLSSPSSNDSRPAWSPDGTLIAFQTTRIGSEQIWIMGADGSSAREFSRKDDGVAFQPSWSNNQESLIYLHSYDLPWVASRRYNVPGAKEIRISQLQPVGSPKFSPDDNWLVMEIRQDNNWDIYRMLSNGAQVIRLTDDTAIDFHPDWQP